MYGLPFVVMRAMVVEFHQEEKFVGLGAQHYFSA